MNPKLLKILLTDPSASAVLAVLTAHILDQHSGWLYLTPRRGMSLGMCQDAVKEAVAWTYVEVSGDLLNILHYEAEAVYATAYERAERINPDLRSRHAGSVVDYSELQ